MILPGHEDPCNLRKSKWDQQMGKIHIVIRCVIRWDMVQDASYLPQGPPNIYSHLHSPSPLLLHLCMPLSPSSSRLSWYLRTPAVAQSSARLSGSGGEKWIFPPQRVPLPKKQGYGKTVITFPSLPNSWNPAGAIAPPLLKCQHSTLLNKVSESDHAPSS